MIRRTILRSAPLVLAAATLLSACAELPSESGIRSPGAPLLTVTPTNPFSVIDGGPVHACGISGGQAWCWGRNNYGQLGNNSYTNSSVAVAASQGALSFSHIAAADSHTCALTTSTGLAYCWGSNADGRVGDSTAMNNRPTPVAVYGSIAFTSITAGEAHTCGLTSTGQTYCWGANDYGQLGDNTTDFSRIPQAVQQPVGVTFFQIAAGKWHTCGLALGGQSYCWGYGGDGQLGYGLTVGDSVPQAVSHPVGVSFGSIYTGYIHTCALTTGGYAYCWGKNSNAQLGDSTTTARYTPVAARMPAGVTYNELATAAFSTCGISSTYQAYCWGLGSSGQLGNGSTANSRLPVAVSQPSGVEFYQIRAESTGICATDGGAQAWCWGSNLYGQLGDNSTTNASSPVAVVH